MLIDLEADVNVKGGVGDRPLHLAAAKGYLKVVQKLVEGRQDNKAQGSKIHNAVSRVQ